MTTDVSARRMQDSSAHDENDSDLHAFPDALLTALLAGLQEPAAIAAPMDDDATGLRFVLLNRALCRLTGVAEEDLLDQGFARLLTPNVSPDELQPLRDALRNHAPVQIDVPILREGGAALPARLSLTPLPQADGSTSVFLLTLPDLLAPEQPGQQAREIFESTTDKVFILDAGWHFTYLNQKARQNIARGRELLGQLFWDAFPETIGTAFEEGYRRAMRDQVPVSFEAYYPPLQTWYEIHANPSPTQLTVYFRNINQRKQSEQAILLQSAQLAEVQQLARVCRWEFDPVREWMTFSGNAAEVLAPGLGPDGCPVHNLLQFVHPEDRFAAAALLTRTDQSSDSSDVTMRMQWPGQDIRFFLLRAQTDARPAVRGILQDITAHKRAELERQESEHRFRLIFESAFSGITITTLDGRFIDVNPTFAAMTEYTREELRSMTFLDLAHPDDRELNQRSAERLIAGEVSSLTFEKRNITKSGRPVWMRLHVSMVVNPLTGSRNLIGIIHDITRQKQTEEALQRSEAQLRQSQKMEAVGRLAGGIAHDFNNLLTVINGYSSLLLNELPAADPLRNVVGHISRAGEKAASLTEQLMAFGRKQVLRPATLDLNQVVSGMEPLLRRLLREDIHLTMECAPAPVFVKADQNQLEQVLLNLCVNARDAMAEGGSLNIAVETVPLSPEDAPSDPAIQPGDYARLTIRDTGHGMDEATRQHAFEPFFTTRTSEGASGLGLSTVYGIVQQNGGTIGILSAPGQGTTVQVHLPLMQAKFLARKRTSDTSPLRGTETILLAEDEPEVRTFLTTVLRQYGYEVLTAAHGAEALELARQHAGTIHLLATDMIMPGMNGRILAGQIREARPSTKVLFISGYTDSALDPVTDLNAEVQYLKKPFTPRELIRAIRALLDTAK